MYSLGWMEYDYYYRKIKCEMKSRGEYRRGYVLSNKQHEISGQRGPMRTQLTLVTVKAIGFSTQ